MIAIIYDSSINVNITKTMNNTTNEINGTGLLSEYFANIEIYTQIREHAKLEFEKISYESRLWPRRID